MDQEQELRGAIWGGIVGDALGVPVEFCNRRSLDADPVQNMRAYGTHQQVAGTWSDDSSLALATMNVLIDHGYDNIKLLEGFSRWACGNWWTAHGRVFDIGIATSKSIDAFNAGAQNPGCSGEYDNGNGSLMRIMPISLYYHRSSPETIIRRCMACSALTHAHVRSQLCCALHGLLVSQLLNGVDLSTALDQSVQLLDPHIPAAEKEILHLLCSGHVLNEVRSNIQGSGYVVHCLEASLWCLAQHNNYTDTVLAAVNLGDDTDTTACVCGGLAGLIYGYHAIPAQWLDVLARRDDIRQLEDRFLQILE